jgi:hypothetical protein
MILVEWDKGMRYIYTLANNRRRQAKDLRDDRPVR